MCHSALNVDLAVVRYHTMNANPNNLTIEPTIVCITKQSIIESCTTSGTYPWSFMTHIP